MHYFSVNFAVSDSSSEATGASSSSALFCASISSRRRSPTYPATSNRREHPLGHLTASDRRAGEPGRAKKTTIGRSRKEKEKLVPPRLQATGEIIPQLRHTLRRRKKRDKLSQLFFTSSCTSFWALALFLGGGGAHR